MWDIYNNREKMTAISIYLHATDAEKARKWREFTLKGTISIPMPWCHGSSPSSFIVVVMVFRPAVITAWPLDPILRLSFFLLYLFFFCIFFFFRVFLLWFWSFEHFEHFWAFQAFLSTYSISLLLTLVLPLLIILFHYIIRCWPSVQIHSDLFRLLFL